MTNELNRKERGLKQTELAPEIGISWRAYQNYERGHREPTLSTLVALADFYCISVDDLICHQVKRPDEERERQEVKPWRN